MKRILSFLVIVSLLLSPTVLTPSAVDLEGDWMVFRQANDYPEYDPDSEDQPAYIPAPGYEYTDEGFTTIPADYTDTKPYFNVQTKDKYNIKDGLYLKFRIDDFSYAGEDGKADEWIALSLWDSQNLAPGQVGYGAGWLGLIRGKGDGSSTTINVCETTSHTDTSKGAFRYLDTMGLHITPVIDDEGREVYTLEVNWIDGAYVITVCGTELNYGAETTALLESLNAEGDFYVGISLHSSVKNGRASITILEFGSSVDDASVPQGSDSKEPEENVNRVADMMDSSRIAPNMPAVYFDAASYKPGERSNLEMSAMGDNGYLVEVLMNPSYFAWTVDRDISYAVDDFPIFTMLVKNYWAEGILRYFCGDVVSATADTAVGYNVFNNGIWFEDDAYEDYTLIMIDLTGRCTGRINGFRIEFASVNLAEPEFELKYAGCFRSEDEAKSYAATYLEAGEDAFEKQTESVPETDGEQTTSDATQGTVDTDGDSSEANPNSQTTQADTDIVEKGCSSTVGIGAGLAVAMAAAVVALMKKKEPIS